MSNFAKDWNDGSLLCELIDAIDPGARLGGKGLNKREALKNASLGVDAATERLNIPCVLAPEDMINPELDGNAILFSSPRAFMHDLHIILPRRLSA